MGLTVALGAHTNVGRRERNEDFHGIVTPEGEQRAVKGVMAAVADGVSGNDGGREAAEQTVRSLLSDYYATPDTWEIAAAIDKVLAAANRWLLAQGAVRRELAGMACTLSALVLRGNRYTVAHVGDSRIYRLRGESFQQLTTDHVWDRPDMRHVLRRAVGLDSHLAVDFLDGELKPDDRFVLVTDGVWEPLGEKTMHEILHLHLDPQRAAEALSNLAVARGGQDNATAMVIRVDQVPEQDSLGDMVAAGRGLSLPPRFKPGNRIDGYEILELLHESRETLLYKVQHEDSGQVLVLKTLQPALRDDGPSCEGLLAEEWIGKRVVSHYFPQVIPAPGGVRSALYYLMAYYPGMTLQQKVDAGQHFSAVEVTGIGIRLAKGLSVLHRLNVVHRDVKPANLHMADDGKLRILDLGVAYTPGLGPGYRGNPGTPSYMAPELFSGGEAGIRSDIYGAGVTLYYLLTRKYPYGEVEPFQRPHFGDPIPPTRYRPDIPQWLENVILKAVARDPSQRFETADELQVALERSERNELVVQRRTPLAKRNPAILWRLIAIASIVVNLLLLYLLAVI